jgi:hypothetical protein
MELDELIKVMLEEIEEIMYLSDDLKDKEISEKMIRILENNYDINID